MKTLLKYSGIISAVLAIVAFILLLVTPGVSGKNAVGSTDFVGAACIFGGDVKDGIVVFPCSGTWAGILAFILIIVALVILICAIVLPLLKVKAFTKVAGALNLVAVIALILAGIFAFCIVGAFTSVNTDLVFKGYNYSIGAGWVIAGILSIVAGVFAILPAAVDFVSKK